MEQLDPFMIETDVIIIGAGHNGLTCAAYLAMAGLRVRVVERRKVVGGGRGHGGISSRLPQFGRGLHRKPAQSAGDP
ncbi:ribulose 1,5-bisphosphate synthetase/thiazole synthase [Bradyrhizobium sp. USDA 3051]